VRVRYLRRINRLKKGVNIHPGQRLRVRRHVYLPRRMSAGSRRWSRRHLKKSHKKWLVHVVKKGDTLWKIADHHDVSLRRLIRNNDFGKRPHIYPGDRIRVRVATGRRLKGSVQLSHSGAGYIRMRPKRSWGTPGTIRLMEEVYAEMARLYPDGPRGYVADISLRGGGPLRPHKSHQRGVDADISYYKAGNEPTRGLEVMNSQTLDVAKTWDLIRLLLNTGHMKVIFMDYNLQAVLYDHLVHIGYDDEVIARIVQFPRRKANRRAFVRHSPGHHHHLHIRFDCVKMDDPCRRPRIAVIPAPPVKVAAKPAPVPVRRAAAAAVQPRPSRRIVRGGDTQTGGRRARATIESKVEKVDWVAVFKMGPPQTAARKQAGARNRRVRIYRDTESSARMTRLGPTAK
jgi:LysM repeat protein